MTENYFESGYAAINGLNMYYEIHGQGRPLVLLHGGGSTIETTFGRIIPLLAQNRQIIAMELQAHGRTNDRDTGLSFEQDADDVAALLHHFKIENADFLGFSNGGQTMIAMALRHPYLIRKMIIASIFYKSSAVHPQFWDGFDSVTLAHMPEVLKEGYLKVNNDQAGLLNMFNRDVQRMKNFKGWTDGQMQSIAIPTLIINGNQDVGSLEHAVEICRNVPDSELVVFPGGHGTYIGTIESLDNDQLPAFNAVPLIETFLDKA
jgi:pimeloyl-ACP methyl ester carboxylesterase